ncbi:MAG: hypothetical protein JST92_01255 [Deltaproteobacteria bacterium]|nr:hypothetical protein [Deltaproteobacteria bacterium]
MSVVVHQLWIGELGELERLSMRSYVAQGHIVWLWTYGGVGEVPEGVQVKNAGEILHPSRIFRYREHDSVSGFSNIFRYKVLYERGGTWSDSDVICLRPLPAHDYLLPSEDHPEFGVQRASCLLRAPAGSRFLGTLLKRATEPHPSTLQWGQIGPRLVTQVAQELGLAPLSPSAFCPVPFTQWRKLLSGEPCVRREVDEAVSGAWGLHCWHELWRREGRTFAHAEEGSILRELAARHGLPVPATVPVESDVSRPSAA